MESFADALAAFFLGSIILAPVAALSARFAMKPILALMSRRLVTDELTVRVAEQGRKIELLEAELAALHESMKRLSAATEFERQLAGPQRG